MALHGKGDAQRLERVAVKVVRDVLGNREDGERVLREVRLLRELCHPNVRNGIILIIILLLH